MDIAKRSSWNRLTSVGSVLLTLVIPPGALICPVDVVQHAALYDVDVTYSGLVYTWSVCIVNSGVVCKWRVGIVTNDDIPEMKPCCCFDLLPSHVLMLVYKR